MLVEILLKDTGVSANWVTAGAVSIAVFLLWRLLNKMDTRIDKLELETVEIKKEQAVMRAENNPDKVADVISAAVLRDLRNDPNVKYG